MTRYLVIIPPEAGSAHDDPSYLGIEAPNEREAWDLARDLSGADSLASEPIILSKVQIDRVLDDDHIARTPRRYQKETT